MLAGVCLMALAVLAAAAAAGEYGCNSNGDKCCLPGSSCSGLPGCPGGTTRASQLWGCRGESWNRDRLPVDWSYAGYKAGEAGVPDVRVAADVKAWGAKGDGYSDDTDAVQRAVDSIKTQGALYFPPGKYVITRKVTIRTAVVLRGAGPDSTTLYFPKSLTEAHGNSWAGGRSQWSHSECFINFMGWDSVRTWGGGREGNTRVAGVSSYAPSGSDIVQLDQWGDLKQGEWVRVTMSDSGGGNLIKMLLGWLSNDGWRNDGSQKSARHLTRVKEVLGGNRFRLERPLPWDLKTEFKPEVYRYRPSVEGAGVERLTIEFPFTKYPGHLKEAGYNALMLNQVAHSWVRNVRIVNSDTAIYLWAVTFSTVVDVEITTRGGQRASQAEVRQDGPLRWSGLNCNGHRAVWAEGGSNNRIQRVNVVKRFMHDFSVAQFETADVFADCGGEDVALDFHTGAPYANLYTNIDLGKAERVFWSGGGDGGGAHSGAYNTFWNLHGDRAVQMPPNDFAARLNFVGVHTSAGGRDGSLLRVASAWTVDGTSWVYPNNLADAMRKRRLGW